MGEPIRVMIAEDNEDLRMTLSALLAAEADISCVAATGRLQEVVPLAQSAAAQVIILDLEMQGQSSLTALPKMRQALPHTRFLVHSGYALPALIDGALAAGASGYVLKSGDFAELLNAIRACATD